MKRLLHRISGLWKHRIALSLLVFTVIVGFLDDNSVWNIVRLYLTNLELQEQIGAYERRYESDTQSLHDISSSSDGVVSVARYRHWMKAENEDIFIVTRE